MSENDKRKGRFENLKDLYLVSSIGVQLVVSIFIGLAFGIYLDSKIGTSPLFTIIFLLFGMVAGFMNIFRASKGYNDNSNDE